MSPDENEKREIEEVDASAAEPAPDPANGTVFIEPTAEPAPVPVVNFEGNAKACAVCGTITTAAICAVDGNAV